LVLFSFFPLKGGSPGRYSTRCFESTLRDQPCAGVPPPLAYDYFPFQSLLHVFFFRQWFPSVVPSVPLRKFFFLKGLASFLLVSPPVGGGFVGGCLFFFSSRNTPFGKVYFVPVWDGLLINVSFLSSQRFWRTSLLNFLFP